MTQFMAQHKALSLSPLLVWRHIECLLGAAHRLHHGSGTSLQLSSASVTSGRRDDGTILQRHHHASTRARSCPTCRPVLSRRSRQHQSQRARLRSLSVFGSTSARCTLRRFGICSSDQFGFTGGGGQKMRAACIRLRSLRIRDHCVRDSLDELTHLIGGSCTGCMNESTWHRSRIGCRCLLRITCWYGGT